MNSRLQVAEEVHSLKETIKHALDMKGETHLQPTLYGTIIAINNNLRSARQNLFQFNRKGI